MPRLLLCTTPFATWQFGYLPENNGRLPDSVILTGPAVAKLGYWDLKSLQCKLGYWDLKSLQCKLGYDHLGTVKLIADPFNEMVKELFYDSFGNNMSETEQHIYFPLGFAGGLRDIATGFVCFGFRDYDPSVGRFTTPDPALDVRGDGDIYDYCVDDPVNLVDAEGLRFTSAEAADAARKGHKGVSHPFGARHSTTLTRASKSRSEKKMTIKTVAHNADDNGKTQPYKKDTPSAQDRSRERGKMLQRELGPSLRSFGKGIITYHALRPQTKREKITMLSG